eukprot:SAG11_NODE_215_length_12235_cov_11.843276_8_plen_230_part_00
MRLFAILAPHKSKVFLFFFFGLICAERTLCVRIDVPVHCAGSWGEWSTCSDECGGGTQTRSYVVSTEASNGGTDCSAEAGATESQSCNEAACAVHCVGSWDEWSTCSDECGGGTQTRSYVVSTEASNGGTDCSAEAGATESQSCNEEVVCCAAADTVLAWSGGVLVTGSATFGAEHVPLTNQSSQLRRVVMAVDGFAELGGDDPAFGCNRIPTEHGGYHPDEWSLQLHT